MSLLAESLLVEVGIFPKEISPAAVARAAGVKDKFEKRLRGFFDREQTVFPYVEPQDPAKLLDRIVRPPTEEETAAWLEALGTELGQEFHDLVETARDYLNAMWPKWDIDAGAGPEPCPLSQDDTNEAWSLYQVVNDATRVLDEVDAYTLSDSQALAFRTVLPELYDACMLAVQDEKSRRNRPDKPWAPPWDKDAVLRTLQGIPQEVAPLPQPPPGPIEGTRLKPDPGASLTPGQRADVTKVPKPK